jgi:hypothetical protein
MAALENLKVWTPNPVDTLFKLRIIRYVQLNKALTRAKVKERAVSGFDTGDLSFTLALFV